MRSNSHSIIRNALRSLSGLLHSALSGLDYATAGHSGFEPTVTKGNLTAGTGVTIGGTGTGAVIGAGASVTNSDTGSAAVSSHNGAFTHSDIALNTGARHARSHAITGTSDHTSGATSGKMLKADANGLPIDASNTDTQVAAAVSASHAAATVSAPIALSGQALSLVNNAVSPGTVTVIDIGALAVTSDLVVPTSKAVGTYASAAVAASHARSHALDSTSDHSAGSLSASLPVFTDATPKLVTKSVADTITALGLGVWTTPSYSAGNFTGSESMTWTVEAGDVGTLSYMILGKTMFVVFTINTTTVGGTVDYTLEILVPASKTAVGQTNFLYREYQGTWVVALGYVIGTKIYLQADLINTKWALSTNATYVSGMVFFEIA